MPRTSTFQSALFNHRGAFPAACDWNRKHDVGTVPMMASHPVIGTADAISAYETHGSEQVEQTPVSVGEKVKPSSRDADIVVLSHCSCESNDANKVVRAKQAGDDPDNAVAFVMVACVALGVSMKRTGHDADDAACLWVKENGQVGRSDAVMLDEAQVVLKSLAFGVCACFHHVI